MQLQADESLLLMVDFQAKLLPVIEEGQSALTTATWLAGVAQALGVPIWLTEQYPEGLGHTASALMETLEHRKVWSKHHFAATAESDFIDALAQSGRQQIVLCGTEAHICVLQTALGLLKAGYRVFWLTDATASRRGEEARLARARACAHGAEAVSADMVAYEWLERCDSETFKRLHRTFLKPRASQAVRFF